MKEFFTINETVSAMNAKITNPPKPSPKFMFLKHGSKTVTKKKLVGLHWVEYTEVTPTRYV